MGEMKSSNEWWIEHEMFSDYTIMDPDGWDRKHLVESFFKEKVTKEEFERRLSLSTLVPRIKPMG
jgi:hypothetical protein